MKYSYIAEDSEGRRRRGNIDAGSENEALAHLREDNLVPIQLKELSGVAAARASGRGLNEIEVFEGDVHKTKMKRKKMVTTYNQIAIMLKAGVNLSTTLDVMIDSEDDSKMRKILKEIHEDLMNGSALSASMSQFKCFDAVTLNLVRSGEADGRLERSFTQAAELQEKSANLQGKVKSAATYPAILLVLVVGLVALMNVMIIPAFASMFEGMGKELPGVTLFVLGMSDFFAHWTWLVILAIVGIVFGYKTGRKKSAAFCISIDKFKTKMPIFGQLILVTQVGRFARVLATLLEAGQDFLGSLLMAQSTLSNEYLKAGIIQIADDIRVGIPISDAMAKHPFFAPVFISMVRAGEESGSLGSTLNKMADMYEDEADETTKRLTSMLEPLMTVLVAVVVGTIVLAIVVPMFGMFDLVGNV